MTASQNLETKREQFRAYLEKEGILESISKALVTLYEESDKPKEALAFVRKNIAAAELDSMKAQVESLSQENEKLKSEVASLGKEKAELEIKVQNLEELQKEMADKAAASAAAAAAVVESPKSEDVEKKEAGQDQHMEDVEVESPKPEVEETKQEVQDQPMDAVAEVESIKSEDVVEKKEVAQEQTIEEAKVEVLSKPKSEDVKKKEVVQEEPMEEEPKPEKEIAVEAGGTVVPESKSISEESSSDALAVVDVAAEKPKPDEPKEKIVEASEKPVEGVVGAGDVAKE